jgi:hypothetical protein
LLSAAAALTLIASPAGAEDSNFRLVDDPKCTKKGLSLPLCFSADWGSPENSKKANAKVEFAAYPTAPGPNEIRQRKNKPFVVTDVPASGEKKIVVPFDVLKSVNAKAGGSFNLTGHWAYAQDGGAPASHVWGYKVHPVPVPVPKDFAFPNEGAQQNSAFRRVPIRRVFGMRPALPWMTLRRR